MTNSAVSPLTSPWHANQVGSSAQMLERIMTDALNSGQTFDALDHGREVENIVRQEVLATEDAVRLMLLCARLLDTASAAPNDEYGRKCAFFIARMAAFCEDLHQSPVKFMAERFAVRVQLNNGNLERARILANRIERRIVRMPGGVGKAMLEIPDERDEALVSPATWFVLAEVALGERNFDEVANALARIRELWSGTILNESDVTHFELLSALNSIGRGETEGIAALAYIYSKHDLAPDSPTDKATLARVAAAAGFMGSTEGIGILEAERWRQWGPESREMVEAYLGRKQEQESLDGVRQPLPETEELVDLLMQRLDVPETAEVIQPLPVVEAQLPHEVHQTPHEVHTERANLPLEFDLTLFRLDAITGIFDMYQMTGPLVIDWSGSDGAMIADAVNAGAILSAAALVTSGTIYFNEGAYVDAVFNSDEPELTGMRAVDVLVELHRIGMACLPGSRGYQSMSGLGAERVPERMNARPNNFNLDILRRIDEINGGINSDLPEEVSEAEFLAGIESLGETPDSSTVEVISSTILNPLTDILSAASLTELCRAVCDSISRLNGGEVRVEITAADESTILGFAGCKNSPDLHWQTREAGSLKIKIGHSQITTDGQEALRFVMETAVHRIRLMPGSYCRARNLAVPNFIAVDPLSLELMEEVRIFARMDGTTDDKSQALRHILISGERGTGKEEIARLLHKLSGRSQRKYIQVDGGILNNPDQLAAELFGAAAGAYTGSRGTRKGLVHEAEGGSLFIDEIDEGVTVQSVLKRFSQFGTYKTIGEESTSEADVRLFIATNRIGGGEALIKQDLRDRFWEIRLPPLRERRGDIRPLAEFFALEFAGYVLPASVLGWFETLEWPGNVRQLRNTIERACSLAESPDRLSLELFEEAVERSGGRKLVRVVSDDPEFIPLREGETLKDRVHQVERRIIIETLKETGGNKSQAAAALGLKDRQTMYNKLKILNISEEDFAISQM